MVTPHTLRHTAATWLMQASVDKWEAAGFLGMSVEMIDRVYGHHHPDHLRRAAHALGYRPHQQSLAVPLAAPRRRLPSSPQLTEKNGGGGSRSRTGLFSQFPANRENTAKTRLTFRACLRLQPTLHGFSSWPTPGRSNKNRDFFSGIWDSLRTISEIWQQKRNEGQSMQRRMPKEPFCHTRSYGLVRC
jgi:hypothetical protein